jgi:hypothetical protein
VLSLLLVLSVAGQPAPELRVTVVVEKASVTRRLRRKRSNVPRPLIWINRHNDDFVREVPLKNVRTSCCVGDTSRQNCHVEARDTNNTHLIPLAHGSDALKGCAARDERHSSMAC